MRDEINAALKDATLKQDRRRMSTLRLICAAIKDRDIAARGAGNDRVGDDEILQILAKMIRQRVESTQAYEQAGRLELAEQELEEIDIIKSFLPRQLDEAEMKTVCAEAIRETGARGLRDMGKCMSTLKSRYPGRMDFGKASTIVKQQLGS
jgi:hypothetical protein